MWQHHQELGHAWTNSKPKNKQSGRCLKSVWVLVACVSVGSSDLATVTANWIGGASLPPKGPAEGWGLVLNKEAPNGHKTLSCAASIGGERSPRVQHSSLGVPWEREGRVTAQCAKSPSLNCIRPCIVNTSISKKERKKQAMAEGMFMKQLEGKITWDFTVLMQRFWEWTKVWGWLLWW